MVLEGVWVGPRHLANTCYSGIGLAAGECRGVQCDTSVLFSLLRAFWQWHWKGTCLWWKGCRSAGYLPYRDLNTLLFLCGW